MPSPPPPLPNRIRNRKGAPALACVNLRPFHGLNQPKPASASQFFVTQSSLGCAPGQNISVDIATHSDHRYFRGFIIQAYDPISGHQVGHFLPNADSRPIDSCSAATHRNNQNKRRVTLTWLPPAPLSGVRPQYSSVDMLTAPWMSFFQPAGNQKRQLEATGADSPPPEAPVAATTPTIIGASSDQNNATSALAPPSQPEVANAPLQQVRFRATIVVTYDEFYTGFESSDMNFDKFDYAISSPRPSASK